MRFLLLLVTCVAASKLHCTGDCQQEDVNAKMKLNMELKMLEREKCHLLDSCPVKTANFAQDQACTGGKAGDYECNNIDLLSFLPLREMGSAGNGNDIWGWVDPQTGHEWALMGCTDGTSFVDVTDASNPVYAGFLPSHLGRSSLWRDLKVYKNFVFVISEARDHGMQIFNLEHLRSVKNSEMPLIFDPDQHYNEFGSCHNIVINEDTGFAYGVGSKTCRGGLHIVDIKDPMNPEYISCYQDDGYTHDAQCVVYNGPDTNYRGHEICFNYNEDSLTIVDVTDKREEEIVMLSRVVYEGVAYSHQGWLTEDEAYLLLDDELDEMQGKNDGYTQTRLWDVRDLTKPFIIDSYFAPVQSVDHNMYVKGNLVYQANYESGLRILDVSSISAGSVNEVGFFDVRPESTNIAFNGAWSVWPYAPSGNIMVSSIERGLFMLRYTGKTNSTRQ